MAEKFIGTRVLFGLIKAYRSKKVKYKGYIMPGGSRSSKTISIIQFLMLYCQENENKGLEILIARQKYSDLKDTVMRDFIKFLAMYGFYKEKNHVRSHPQAYNLAGNTIYFRGLDAEGAHGEAYDVIWINEAFEADQDAFLQLNQRLRKFFILDYNPYFTEHWILSSLIEQKDIWVAQTSVVLDNPFNPARVRNEIMAYATSKSERYPTVTDELIAENIRQGTADSFRWSVYGLGIGTVPEGVIFPFVNWIEPHEFPRQLNYWFGLDFGFTNDPSAMVKIAIDGKDIYLEEMFYQSTETSDLLNEIMIAVGIEKNIPIIGDSSDKFVSSKYGGQEMVKDLHKLGWNIQKASKKGKKVEWIRKLKEYRINIVSSTSNGDPTNFKKEQQHYRWRTVNGIQVNDPIDAWDHLWTATFYGGVLYKGRRKLYWD